MSRVCEPRSPGVTDADLGIYNDSDDQFENEEDEDGIGHAPLRDRSADDDDSGYSSAEFDSHSRGHEHDADEDERDEQEDSEEYSQQYSMDEGGTELLESGHTDGSGGMDESISEIQSMSMDASARRHHASPHHDGPLSESIS